jgi:L-lactate dehydrogenase
MQANTGKLTSSIAIIGAGDVGASIAYSLLLNPVAHDIILVDLKEELLEAQVRDLGDATFRGNGGVRVKKGTFEEAGQADIVVITAGAKQKKGKSYNAVRAVSSIEQASDKR